MLQRMPVFLVLIGLFAVQALKPADQNPGGKSDFSVSVNLVKIPISVFNESGDLVTDLWKQDFRVWEDQAPQEIRSFGLDKNPVSVVLLLDTSETEKSDLKKVKKAAEEFAAALDPGDQISLITFDDEVYRVLDWTSDIKKFRKALGKIQTGLRTALYDAMYLAAADQLKGVEGRKAIILLTDCLNNQSIVDMQDAARSIVQSQASLYVVSRMEMVREQAKSEHRVVMLSDIYKRMFGDDNYIEEFFNRKEAEMTELSEKTGGRCFFLTDYDQIKNIYSEVAHELKSTYFLTYVSNQNLRPDSYHRISIEYLKPSTSVIYRKGYYYNLQRDHRIPNAAEFSIRK
jgi:Ca-activated chloride channel homolog